MISDRRYILDEEAKVKIENGIKMLNRYLPLRRRLGTAVYCHSRLMNFPKYNGKTLALDRNQGFLSLYDSMIVSYISCFTSNKSKNIVLKPNKVFSGKRELIEFHEEVEKMRNQIIAHNESILDKGNFSEKDDVITIIFLASIPSLSPAGLRFFEELLKCAWDYMNKKIKKIVEQLESDIGKKIYIDDKVG